MSANAPSSLPRHTDSAPLHSQSPLSSRSVRPSLLAVASESASVLCLFNSDATSHDDSHLQHRATLHALLMNSRLDVTVDQRSQHTAAKRPTRDSRKQQTYAHTHWRQHCFDCVTESRTPITAAPTTAAATAMHRDSSSHASRWPLSRLLLAPTHLTLIRTPASTSSPLTPFTPP